MNQKTNFQLETKLILVLTIYKFRVSGRFSDFFNSEKCIKQTKIFPNWLILISLVHTVVFVRTIFTIFGPHAPLTLFKTEIHFNK